MCNLPFCNHVSLISLFVLILGAVQTVDSSEIYNENWLDGNPSYMVELLDKAQTEQADRNLVGYQVEAGSTKQVTTTQKRKHQITYVAAKARAEQQALNAAIGSGASIRQEAGAKYGW